MSDRRTIHFTLNGEAVSAHIASHETLVELLQDHFSLYGARESCAQGLCGCCTILVDGTAVSGCLYLAAFADGKAVMRRDLRVFNQRGELVQEGWHEMGSPRKPG